MAGIAGILGTGFNPDRLEALRRMAGALRHRGPDGEGYLVFPAPDSPAGTMAGPFCALAHRHCSFDALSSQDRQPMSSVEGGLVLVMDGVIHNGYSLRTELKAGGHRFRSSSDAETVLAALAQWGTGAFTRLEGAFALAILDPARRRLLLVRDLFGTLPLYYAPLPGGLAFASEITALLTLPEVSRRVNLARLYDYLFSSNTDHGDQTLFSAIRALPASHLLEVPLDRLGSAAASRYWSLDLGQLSALSFDQAAERLRALFLESVAARLGWSSADGFRSLRRGGFVFSGDGRPPLAGGRLPTPHLQLCLRYVSDDPAISEEHHVDAVVRAAQAEGCKLRIHAAELERDFDRLVSAQAEPFTSPTIYVQHRLLGLAGERGVRVMFGGQGSDEMLGSYDWYLPARLASLLRGRHGIAAARFLARARGTLGFAELLRSAAGHLVPLPLLRLRHGLAGGHRPPAWIDAAWFTGRGVVAPPRFRGQGPHLLREALQESMFHSHLQAMLRYEDRNGMAFSIETRLPFLTPRLAEFIFSLPEEYIIAPDGTRKAVFRRAMRGLVPDQILNRRDKIGFAVPVVAWLLELAPWVERKLARASGIPGLNHGAVKQQWEAVRSQGSGRDAFLIWRWISLATWADQFQVEFG